MQKELQSRLQEADRLRQAHVVRARFEAEQAQRRYMHVDPAHRLVADSLEAEWNNKLRALEEAQKTYEKQRQSDRRLLDSEQAKENLCFGFRLSRALGKPNYIAPGTQAHDPPHDRRCGSGQKRRNCNPGSI
jgi:excinuclease UvrABC helicase subunit UvrB